MKKLALASAALIVVGLLVSGNVMSQQKRVAPAPVLGVATADPAEPVPVDAAFVDPNAPVAVPAPAFIANGQGIQFFQNGMVQVMDNGWSAMQNAYQQLGQSIAQEKQEKRPSSVNKLKLHKALANYLAEESLNRIAEELKELERQFPEAPAARKAKMALKALTFEVEGEGDE